MVNPLMGPVPGETAYHERHQWVPRAGPDEQLSMATKVRAGQLNTLPAVVRDEMGTSGPHTQQGGGGLHGLL